MDSIEKAQVHEGISIGDYQWLFREGADNIRAISASYEKFQALYNVYIIQSRMPVEKRAIIAQFARIENAFTSHYLPLTREAIPRTLPEAIARVANSTNALIVVLTGINGLIGLIEKEILTAKNGDKSQIGAKIGARCMKLLPGIISRRFTENTLAADNLQTLIRACQECAEPLSTLINRQAEEQARRPFLQA